MDCKKPGAIPRLKQQMMKLQVHVPVEAVDAETEGKLAQNSGVLLLKLNVTLVLE